MIVRNEAHIVHEVLDAVAPYISSWVIVDTGSDDNTQSVIRKHMAKLGIEGELHERPWRNFGHNRSESLVLTQGHGDYIWVIDADDMVVSMPDLGRHQCRYLPTTPPPGSRLHLLALQLFRDTHALSNVQNRAPTLDLAIGIDTYKMATLPTEVWP